LFCLIGIKVKFLLVVVKVRNSPNEVANEAVDCVEGVVAQIRAQCGQGRGGGRGLAGDRG